MLSMSGGVDDEKGSPGCVCQGNLCGMQCGQPHIRVASDTIFLFLLNNPTIVATS